MSYQVLARKWRPQRFAELVGQHHVVSAITHALNNDRLHHAYLFTGTRGVGKTTIARIFSKSLNCDVGQSADPCGKCDTCVSIEQGNYVDLLEIDAASRTKVEDTRELLDNVQYKPTRGRFKVYLIDEVHMLSKHSFNALLKTLEEPPPHVKFLLATTDPQKLPITILSRCLQFNLKALSREQITDQLTRVLNHENIDAEPQGIELLARAANGSMRDALSLTDQAVAQGNNSIKAAVVSDMLGLMDKQILLKLLNAVVSGDKDGIQAYIQAISEQAPDYTQVLGELSSLLHQVALTQWNPESCKLETTSARAIYALAKKLTPEHVQLLYKFVLEGKKELPFSVDGNTCLQMTVMRMTHFAPDTSNIDTYNVIRNPQDHVTSPIKDASQAHDINVETTQTSDGADDLNPPPNYDDHDVAAMHSEQSMLEAQRHDSLDAEASPESPAEAPNTLAKTQALLALKEKLNAERSSEEGAQKAKKSESAQHNDVPPPWITEPADEPVINTMFSPDLSEPDIDDERVTEEVADENCERNSEADLVEVAVVSELRAYLDNGEKLVHAKQIDHWASLIEATGLSGLTKQIALHSDYNRKENQITLLMDESQAHLLNDAAVSQIRSELTGVLGKDISIDVAIGKPQQTPYIIQQQVNEMREAHAKHIVSSNSDIQTLMTTFEAHADEASIKPR
ncbi:DNA polymerase III subunit gamma/tau [Alteromonas sediminis]|uniref:DNA polymerase III subunit gamma/tau n=1 Tax=Alteromonas sediminis TaxID=2259342 RepID=A0A3N5XX27_9ALTE|nr:DNA polymerase III subunit gamma/tau [Alteromonas sediminis]RPJ64903.1 DNA polymerase III subunit gamma/tau [Alteromonas sediminis]